MQESSIQLESRTSSQTALRSGHRVFYDIPDKPSESLDSFKEHLDFVSNNATIIPQYEASEQTNYTKLCAYIEKNIIGRDKNFYGPFGERPIVYCDYTASGKSVKFIEEFIYHEVLPEYANTHTTNTTTSLQTTMYRHEARDIIRNSCHASEHDAVLFVGSGCTAAVHKLIHNLNLIKPPIVIIGPFEHHSNLLPWRHLAHSMHRVDIAPDGSLNLNTLENFLKTHSVIAQQENRPLVGIFAAVSNVTGIVSDVNKISIMMHRFGGLVFWDYASGAPYMEIEMNPVLSIPDSDLAYKDAVYFSMHKFVGGVQAPGILIAKKTLFTPGEQNPEGTGGGTVFFVRRQNQIYLKDVEEREEGGTPDIVGSIRAGLTFQLKDAVGVDMIAKREEYLIRYAWSRFAKFPSNFIILGGNSTVRLPIFSFLIRHDVTTNFSSVNHNAANVNGPDVTKYLYLHHNFVCSLLNDLFGIQSRSGCACAGPYAMDLIGINEELAERIENTLVGNGMEQTVLTKYFEYPHREIIRPGFVRISLPYFMADCEIKYVLDSLEFVALNGYKFLPFYKFNPVTSDWRHRNHDLFRDRKWLGHVSYKRGYMTWRRPQNNEPTSLISSITENTSMLTKYNDLIESANKVMKDLLKTPVDIPDETVSFDSDISVLRWFMLPTEACHVLWNKPKVSKPSFALFHPGSIAPCFRGTKLKESDLKNCNFLNVDSKSETFYDVTSNKIDDKNKNKNNSNNSADVEHVVDNSPLSVPYENVTNSDVICLLQTKHSSKSTDSYQKPTNKQSGYRVTEKNKKNIWKNPPKELFKPLVAAINDFNMIDEGDKLLICLSGGKDSLSLLHCMRQYQMAMRSKLHFTLGATTIDPGSAAYDPSKLIPYLKSLGVEYHYETQHIIEQALDLPYKCESICSFCSRMKRGRIYAVARQYGYNTVVLGQHLDDLTESFVMSIFHNGLMRTMKAKYIIKKGDLKVIRPLVYCREKHTRSFADKASLPVIPENCPGCFEPPKERFRVKMMLAEQEIQFPNLFNSLLTAMKPLMSISTIKFDLQALITQSNNGNHRMIVYKEENNEHDDDGDDDSNDEDN